MSSFYGVNKQTVINSEVDRIVESVRVKGFAVLKNVLEDSERKNYSDRLDTVYSDQLSRIGESNLEKISDLNMVRCPLAEDETFIDLAANQKVLEVIKALLGDYFILHLQNGIINKPNEQHHQSSWHRDLPHQNYSISSPLAIGVLHCIDPFNTSTGGTIAVPFTHQLEEIPSDDYIENNKLQIEANAGDAIIFDSMILHRAGANVSDIVRRGINNVYTKPFLKQQITLPTALDPKYKEDDFLAQFLGFDSEVAMSSDAWRKIKIERANKG